MKRFATGMAVLTVFGMVLAAGVVADEGGPKPPRPKGIGGTIARIEGSTLTLATKGEGRPAAEQTVTADASTEIIVEAEAKLADLKPGDMACVGGTWGEIGRMDGQTVTFVKRREGGTSEHSVTVNADTQILVRKAGSLADLKAGQRVSVQHLEGKATRIEVPAARRGGKEGGKEGGGKRENRIAGQITQVGGNSITISRPVGEGAKAGTKEDTFTVGSDAKIVIEGAAAGLSDLKVGQKVVITYEGPAALRIEMPRTRRAGGEGDGEPEATTPRPPRVPESERRGESAAPKPTRRGREGER
jgi:hypothetical protein